MGGLFRGLLIVAAVALVAPTSAWAADVRVVVALDGPSLAQGIAESRVLTTAAKRRRLELGSATSRAHLASLALRQERFERTLRRTLPHARVGWRYRIVLNALSVTLPAADVPRLARLPGVRAVYPASSYRVQLDRSAGFIGAPRLWNDLLATRGEGMKIGIIDDGIDQTHPFFSPSGYAMPPGFPKGQAAFTTAKVIAARAFAPPELTWRNARLAFDATHSVHGTHVAGIAAGNANTPTSLGTAVSGIAPRAYLGNYKVLSVPTDQFGLNGNAPEIVRGIEAAVTDGMDVINLSLGEPEVEPTRDVVALALDGAAAAGVVPVVAAGNDFRAAGRGSVVSPGTSRRTITVGATEDAEAIAAFSASGPTPLSLRLKPEVVAPGSAILSSAPGEGPALWTLLSGTSMAAPHVAGAVALLRQRHPLWTAAQLKAALVATANPIAGESVFRAGAGIVDLPDADAPFVLPDPPAVSFGVVRPGATLRATIRLDDAGDGAGRWDAAIVGSSGRVSELSATVPGSLAVSLAAGNAEREEAGWIVLSRGRVQRRIPYWFAVARPRLARPVGTLRQGGTYQSSTLGRPARVTRYRYPDLTGERLRGPEQVFRLVLARPAANLGVAVTSGTVEPRILLAPDENRVAGYAALPVNVNPYDDRFDDEARIAGVLQPAARSYYVVFDSHALRGSAFTFRVWIGDTRPPSARVLSATAERGVIRIRVADPGAGIDPSSLRASAKGARLAVRLRGSVASVDVSGLRRGSHMIDFTVADRQEAKNNENVAGVLPNTRRLRVTVRVP